MFWVLQLDTTLESVSTVCKFESQFRINSVLNKRQQFLVHLIFQVVRNRYSVGERVHVRNFGIGTIRYGGRVYGIGADSETFYGIELDEAHGTNGKTSFVRIAELDRI